MKVQNRVSLCKIQNFFFELVVNIFMLIKTMGARSNLISTLSLWKTNTIENTKIYYNYSKL